MPKVIFPKLLSQKTGHSETFLSLKVCSSIYHCYNLLSKFSNKVKKPVINLEPYQNVSKKVLDFF